MERTAMPMMIYQMKVGKTINSLWLSRLLPGKLNHNGLSAINAKLFINLLPVSTLNW